VIEKQEKQKKNNHQLSLSTCLSVTQHCRDLDVRVQILAVIINIILRPSRRGRVKRSTPSVRPVPPIFSKWERRRNY